MSNAYDSASGEVRNSSGLGRAIGSGTLTKAAVAPAQDVLPLRDALCMQDKELDMTFEALDRLEAALGSVLSETVPSREPTNGLTACTDAGRMAVQTVMRLRYMRERIETINCRLHI